MKSASTIGVIACLLATTALPARASEEWSFEAFQPIWTFSDLRITRVTIATYHSTASAILAVGATTDSNQVLTQSGFQQRNAAYAVGLSAEVMYNSNRESPLFGDTLRVIVHCTRPANDIDDYSYGTILAATVQCILANAAQLTAIRFVAVTVEGAPEFAEYGGVYRTARFRLGPRKRDFR